MNRRRVLAAYSAYYVTTGLSAFVSRRAFEAVTGPKSEWWLVETVGGLATVIGGAVGAAAAADRVTPEITALATGSATVFAGIDTVYVARGRIRPTYLVDAAVQAALIAALARSR